MQHRNTASTLRTHFHQFDNTGAASQKHVAKSRTQQNMYLQYNTPTLPWYCCSYFPYCLFSFILLIHQLFNFPITLLAPVSSVQSSIHVFLCSPCFFLVSQQFLLNVFAPPQSLLVHFLYFWWRIKYPTTCLPDHLSCSSLHLNQSIILRVTTLCCMATLS